MTSNTLVEIADRYSRKRAALAAVAALAFLLVQVFARPFFTAGQDATHHVQRALWAVNVVALLLGLVTGGGLLTRFEIRTLVHDEVSRRHGTMAAIAGYVVAMTIAMGLYVVPTFARFTAPETVYIIVSGSVIVALLAFSYLEYRAHRDA